MALSCKDVRCLNLLLRNLFSQSNHHHIGKPFALISQFNNKGRTSFHCRRRTPAYSIFRKYCTPAADIWEPGYSSKYCPPSPSEIMEIKMKEKFENRIEFSFEEWEEFRIEMLDMYFLLNEGNFDSITMNALLASNNMPLAHTFMKYLRQIDVKPNIVTNCKFMVLCSKNLKSCTQDDILSAFNKVKPILDSSLVLDNVTVNCIIQGLCVTSEWKMSFEYLKKLPINNPHYSMKNAIAMAALRNDEEDLGWKIITTWYSSTITANNDVFTEYVSFVLRSYAKNPVGATSLMNKLLEFLQMRNVIPDSALAKEIRKFFKCQPEKWKVSESKINSSSMCGGCQRILKSEKLTPEEFECLKETFFEKSLYKSDIFINTTREELGKFVMFVSRRKPFDFVVDGLNAAHLSDELKSRKNLAIQLLNVVDELSATSNRILVLGRRHMKGWPNNILNRIRNKAFLFLTNNTSQDDPFLIYAALASGPKSLIVSSDLMRDHMSRLSDPSLIKIFNRWRQSHQVYVSSEKSITSLVGPLKHSISIQGSNSEGWHIPYDDAFVREPYEVLNNWLCVHPIATKNKKLDIDVNSYYK